MRIGVDAQTLLRQDAGVTYYTKGILAEILRHDHKNFYDLLFMRPFPTNMPHFLGNGSNFSYRYEKYFPAKLFRYFMYAGLGIPLETFFGQHELYFFPNFVAFPHRRGRSVVVIHDLSFEKVPQYVPLGNRLYLKRFVPLSVERADHVIANSEFTKSDLVSTYGTPARKISVVYPGVDREIFRPLGEEEKEMVKRKYGIKKPYLLYFGMLEPRKNIPAILKAYAALPNRREFNLVLAGKKGWLYEEIFATVQKLGIGEDVIFTGYVPEEDRPQLLSGAEVFVYPSFFEGFGMPVVEAQACGVPVVTSNITSLPEAAGGAALLVDPQAVEELTGAMTRILSSPHLQEELREKGGENAKKFRWDVSAKKTIDVFNSLS